MTEYRQGQRVRVEYEATVAIAAGGTLQILPDHYAAGHSQMLALPLSAGLKVEVLNPSGWPPQVGDIWEADGIEWYIRTSRSVTSALAAVSDDGPDYEVFLGKLKARNPALIRRRGQ